MGKPKSPTSTSPQVVATLSSLLLLVVSAGLGFYFTELRGPGFRTLLSGSQASELLVLVGGLAAIVLTGHLAIANAARSAQGASGYRKLVRKASEVDYSDPAATSQFDHVPELRDLVRVLVAEKEQGRQLQDTLESVRGETRGLFDGMQRSLKDFGKMREDQASELGRKLATLWNMLIERVQEAEATPTSRVTASTAAASHDSDDHDVTAIAQRLVDLEARVQQLQAVGGGGSLLVSEDDIVTAHSSPLLTTEDVPEVVELEESLDPVGPLVLQEEPQDPEDPLLEALEPLSDEEVAVSAPAFEPGSPAVEEAPEVAPVPSQAPTFSGPWQEEASEAAVVKPQVAAESRVDVRPAGNEQASESTDVDDEGERTFTEWSGAGFGSLSSLTKNNQPGVAAMPPPAPAGNTGKPEVGFGKPATPGSPAFSFTRTSGEAAAPRQETADVSGMSFPKFASQPESKSEDHVEVTYEGSTATDTGDDFMSFDAPAEDAIIDEGPTFEIDDDDVVDLKSLGAVETKE